MDQNFPKHKPKQIEFIQQRHKSDCGIACVAMLTGQLYDIIESLFRSVFRNSTKGGIYPEEMSDMFECFGFSFKPTKVVPKNEKALVGIQWKKSYSGHYIVWDPKRKQFLDPICGVFTYNDLIKYATIQEMWIIKKKARKNEQNRSMD